MGRRIVATVVVALAVLGATMLGAAGAAFRTSSGRTVVAAFGVNVLRGLLHGTTEVGRVGGSFTEGLELRDVVIRGEDGLPFARLPRVRIRYRLRDLLSGRIVLGQVVLSEPQLDIHETPNGRLNYQEVLGLGGPSGGGRPPLVAFHDAVIDGGTVVIRTPVDAPDDVDAETVKTERGWMHVRRIEGLNARVAYVRLSSPFPSERALRFDVADLQVRLSDPALDIRGMEGRLEIDGDSMAVDLDELILPHTKVAVEGAIQWPNGNLLLALDIDGRQIAVNDVRGLVSPLPWGLTGRGRIAVQSLDTERLSFRAPDLYLEGPNNGGSISGRLGLVLGPDGRRLVQDTDLRTRRLDLEYLRPLLDTIPLAGRLSGRVIADGPTDVLYTQVDWTFQDSLVPAWPQTRIRGEGVVALDGSDDTPVFYNFRVDSADIALSTVRRLFPVIGLEGRVGGSGWLDGAWQQLEFRGALHHADGELPASVARGRILLDSRADTVGLWAELTLDSLNLAGIHPSYPSLPGRGTLAGPVELAGYADSLRFNAALSGPAGDLAGEGHLVLLPSVLAGRALDIRFHRLDLSGFGEAFLPTELYGSMAGAIDVDSASAPRGQFLVAVDASLVAGSPVDSVRGAVGVGDSALVVRQVTAWAPASRFEADGRLSLGGTRRGAVNVRARVDSLQVMEPLLRELFGLGSENEWLSGLTGTAAGEATIEGSLDHYQAHTSLSVDWAASAVGLLERLNVAAAWGSEVDDSLAVSTTVDTVAVGRFAFSDLAMHLNGLKHRPRWDARARLGVGGSWVGWGLAYLDSASVTVPFDSMGLLLPTHAWFLDRGAAAAVSDSGVEFTDFRLASRDGGASVNIAGRIPREGPGPVTGSLTALPLADVWALAQLDYESVGGEVNGTFEARGRARAPIIHASLALREGRFGAFRTPNLEGTTSYEDRRLIGDFRLWRAGQEILALAYEFPLDLAFVDAERRRLPGPLHVRAVASGVDLSFMELVTPAVQQVGGTLDADVGIAGSWERPELTGNLSITDGRARYRGLGVTHRDVNGRLALSGDTIRVEQLSLRSGEGEVTVSGFVRLEGLTRPVTNLQMAARRFQTIDVANFLTLNLTGDLRLAGPVFGARLTGRGTVTSGVVYFADLVEKEIVNLEDTLFGSLIDTSLIRRQGLGASFENRVLDSLRIDSLRLEMGSDAWLRSSEANIQLTGQVVVGKVGDRYRIDGTLNTPRGQYRLPIARGTGFGELIVRDFTVTDGTVQYFGTPDLDAAVNINARHVVRRTRGDNITVFVNVGGTLYEPQVTLSSDVRPPLPESEIISYLLFGVPSLAALGERGDNLLRDVAFPEFVGGALSGELERSIISDLGVPIDYLQIRPEFGRGLTGTEIAVGRQFGSRVFVTLSPRVCPTEEFFRNVGISAELQLTRNWHLAASSDPARCGVVSGAVPPIQQVGLDLFWEKRY